MLLADKMVPPGSSAISAKSSAVVAVLVAGVCSLLVIALRAGGIPDVENSLWAEDGIIFLNQALAGGKSAFIEPYAGYLHLWPRLVAFISSFYNLGFAPYVLFTGWALSFFLTAVIIVYRLRAVTPWFFCACVVLLMGMQPATGETFFTVTNSQWSLSIALAVLLLVDTSGKRSALDYVGVFVLSLTGPFSVLMAPAVILKMFLYGKRKDSVFYLLFFFCVVVQLFFITHADRIVSGPANTHLHEWLAALAVFFLFGMKSTVAICLAVVFWLLLAVALVLNAKHLVAKGPSSIKAAMLLLLVAGTLYAAGLWSHKADPAMLTPLGFAARYFFPVYGLIFVAAVMLLHSRKFYLVTVLGVAAGICYLSINTRERAPDKTPSNYKAYAAFSDARSGVVISIHPLSPSYPGWHVADPRPRKESLAGDSFDYDMADLVVSGTGVNPTPNGVVIEGAAAQFLLGSAKSWTCHAAKYVGVEIDMQLSSGGWIQAYWQTEKEPDSVHAPKRFYPEGEVVAHFAMPYLDSDLPFTLNKVDVGGEITISRIRIYCLGENE